MAKNEIQGFWVTDTAYVDLIRSKVLYKDSAEDKEIDTAIKYRLLELLYINHDIILSKARIKEYIWPYKDPFDIRDNSLVQQIRKVRVLVGDENGRYICTYKGRDDDGGYKFCMPEQKPAPVRMREDKMDDVLEIEPNTNIFASKKKYIEKSIKPFSIENRCTGAKQIIQICYAGTAFLANDNISSEYLNEWYRYYRNLLETAKIDLVFISPESPQMKNLINYYLRPKVSNASVNRSFPFQKNYVRIMKIMDDIRDGELRNTDLNVYFADPFSLPCSFFQCIFDDEHRDKDSIKFDLYVPFFSSYNTDEKGNKYIPDGELSDDDRPSFILLRKQSEIMYQVLSRNISEILEHSTQVIKNSAFVNDDWKAKFEDYANGKFKCPFKETDILDNLL